jgi:hypothetical protein
VIEAGAFIGSDTMLVAPVRVGAGAKTGAGAVVTRDVPAYAQMVGTPARQSAWRCRCGERLADFVPGAEGSEESTRDEACSTCGARYRVTTGAGWQTVSAAE